LPGDVTNFVPETWCFNFYFKQEVTEIVNDSKRVLMDNFISNITFI